MSDSLHICAGPMTRCGGSHVCACGRMCACGCMCVPRSRRDPVPHLKALFNDRFRSQEAALQTIVESVESWHAECVSLFRPVSAMQFVGVGGDCRRYWGKLTVLWV